MASSRNQKRAKPSEGSFTEDQLMWNDSRLSGRRRELDQTLGSLRTGSNEQLEKSRSTFVAREADVSNKPATRDGARRDIDRTDRLMRDMPAEGNRTQISDIQGRHGAILGRAIQSAHDNHTAIPGTGWYFDHNRSAQAELPDGHDLSGRQVAAMGAKLSSGKTPEDERTSMAGIYDLIRNHSDKSVDGTPVASMTSEQIGSASSRAAGHSAYNSGATKSAPDSPNPVAEADTYDALRRAGRAHSENVISATRVARGEVAPADVFDPGATPKTSAYGEMQVQSVPGSLEETDYRNISAHYRDVAAGTQDRNQGMMMYSQDQPGPRSHALSSSSPTAIDTWMIAAGSGAPLAAKTNDDGTGRTYSPAKRLADKDFPLSPDANSKTEIGVGLGDTSMTPQAMVSAQHNEAIRRLSENTIGAVSFDQHGQDVHLPSSLIQESVWTQARREAGGDKPYNVEQRNEASQSKASDKRTKEIQKLSTQPSLF